MAIARLRFCALVCVFAVGSSTGLSSNSIQEIPIRKLDGSIERSPEAFGAVGVVKAFSNGRVVVSDAARRRILLLDSSLHLVAVVIDSASGASGSSIYPPVLIPFVGDSCLLLDQASLGFVVLGPDGITPKVIAAARSSDLGSVIPSGAPVLDSRGRLYYRGGFIFRRAGPGTPAIMSDSMAVLRADFERRIVDTVGAIHVGGSRRETVTLPSGVRTAKITINPVTADDDWAVVADGSLAIVRAQDYHIDWVRPDGTRISTPKMPIDWRKISDDEKQRLIDSTSNAMRASLARLAATSPSVVPPQLAVVDAKSIPDYFPPITPRSMKSDLDGNLWIPPRSSRLGGTGGLVYDVVSNAGHIAERVQLPPGRSIIGFGPLGAVYMSAHDSTGSHFERTHLRRR